MLFSLNLVKVSIVWNSLSLTRVIFGRCKGGICMVCVLLYAIGFPFKPQYFILYSNIYSQYASTVCIVFNDFVLNRHVTITE
jgi:hypothetical protein